MVLEASQRAAEPSASVTHPDVLLPSQYFGSRRMETPEHRLMIAVLLDALDCIRKHRDQRLFDEAKHWFLADETEWPYSFEQICAALDLDADDVRRRLGVVPHSHPIAESRRRLFFGEESWKALNAEPLPSRSPEDRRRTFTS